MSQREKEERWFARKINKHWAIVEPILPTARHSPRARRNLTKGQRAMAVAKLLLRACANWEMACGGIPVNTAAISGTERSNAATHSARRCTCGAFS